MHRPQGAQLMQLGLSLNAGSPRRATETRRALKAEGLYPSACGAFEAMHNRRAFRESIVAALDYLPASDLFSVFIITGRLSRYKAIQPRSPIDTMSQGRLF